MQHQTRWMREFTYGSKSSTSRPHGIDPTKILRGGDFERLQEDQHTLATFQQELGRQGSLDAFEMVDRNYD